jgi:hypothetical protein
VLLTCRPLLIFAACAIMFHFANAAMLPLVGEKAALEDKNLGTTLMSASIVAAQIVMAMLVGAKADAWGRKPLVRFRFSRFVARQGTARRSLRSPLSPSLGLRSLCLRCPKHTAACGPKPNEAKPCSLQSRS